MLKKTFQSIINESYVNKLYAHSTGDYNETLEEHSESTLKMFNHIKEDTIKSIASQLSVEEDVLSHFLEVAMFFHDVGKATPYFQSSKMNAISLSGTFDKKLSNHSLLSSVYYMDIMFKYLESIKNDISMEPYLLIVFNIAQCVAKHHSKLTDLEIFCEDFDEYLLELAQLQEDTILFDYFKYKPNLIGKRNFLIKKFKKCIEKCSNEFLEGLYSSSLIFFSLLTISDILATKEFTQSFHLEKDDYDNGLKRYLNLSYNESQLNQYVLDYKNNPTSVSELNAIRSEFIINLDERLSSLTGTEHMFYLEGMVGIGKTHAAQRFALKMLEGNCKKIYWSVPYLSIVNQVTNLNHLIDNQSVQLDSTTMIRKEYSNHQIDYSKMVVNDQLMNYRQATFTFVRLFNILFSSSKSSALKRLSLRDSVIILDELQSIDINLMKQFLNQIELMSKLLNCKVLFMSATLPELPNTISLSDANYFRKKELLKNRNHLNFDFFSQKMTHIEIIEKLSLNNFRLLIQCVTKKKAVPIYDELVGLYPDVYLYTGDTDKTIKKELIECLQAKKTDGSYLKDKFILVTTNAIEAGVDISMNQAIVDLTSLDSLEQLSGRINRNNEFDNERSIIYIINQENADFMSPIKINYTKSLGISGVEKAFKEKNYLNFMTEVLKQADYSNRRSNQISSIRNLAFKKISQMMKLITSDSCYYYHIKDNKSKELQQQYEQYKIYDRQDFDEFYIKRKETLIALQPYRHEIKEKEMKQKFLEEYGDQSIVFYECHHTFEDNNK